MKPNRTLELLIIEENPADVSLLEKSFREVKANVRIQVAKDGDEGLQMVLGASPERVKRPDLILFDPDPSNVTGYEALKRLKTNPQTCRIPVLVLTSSAGANSMGHEYECRANAYLRKPTTSDGYLDAARDIKTFWLETAVLPS